MLGFSLDEFLLTLVIAIVVIGPKDIPEVARYVTKFIIKSKHLIAKVKTDLNEIGKEIGIDEIKNEVAIELANEKARLEKDVTTIIDIYGNEHQVSGIDEIRKDKSKEEIAKEVEELNKLNKKTDS